MRGVIGAAVLAGGLAGPVAAQCTAEHEAAGAALAAAWAARETVAAPAVGDAEAARCVQDAFAAAIGGAPVGWKVGLTSRAAQEQFGVEEPVAGRLLEGMVIEDGATVVAAFGGRPVVEADLMVSVRDAGIMAATTRAEALDHLDYFIPFIELADLMVTPGEPLSAEIITAINVGARLGVAGAPVPMEPGEDWEEALAEMVVRVEDGAGTDMGSFPGSAILGHPLDAVLWLVAHLRERGESLGPGDLLSLGSFGPPVPPGELAGFRVTYEGLPGGTLARVRVAFD